MKGTKRISAVRGRSQSAKRGTKKGKYGNQNQQVVMAKGVKQMFTKVLGNATTVRLHYLGQETLNPGVGGAVVDRVYRLGSIFDPEWTGAGHQPMGHDELSGVFERYQVFRVDYHIEFVNLDGSNPQRVGYRISDSSATTTTPSDNIEQGQVEWNYIGPLGSEPKKFTGTVKNSDVHGISYRQYMANDDYGAVFGNNPTEDVFLHVWADGIDADTSNIKATVHLVYHTKLMGSRLMTAS